MKYGSYEHRDAQFKAIEEITELFLTVPLQKPLISDENGNMVRDAEADKLENLALKEQFFKLDDVIRASEGLQPWFVSRLVSMLQQKAQTEIARRNALALTIDPDFLAKHGVPEHLIEGTKEIHEYLRKEITAKGGRVAGKKQTLKQIENEETHIAFYKMFLDDPSIYKFKKTNYLDAMRDKTGATPKTVNDHLKKHNLFDKKLR